MRTTHQTLPAALAMDVMPPWRAFRTPSVPSARDPRRWFGVVLAALARVAGRVDRPGTTPRSPAEGMGS
jgi:hypothetical protein